MTTTLTLASGHLQCAIALGEKMRLTPIKHGLRGNVAEGDVKLNLVVTRETLKSWKARRAIVPHVWPVRLRSCARRPSDRGKTVSTTSLSFPEMAGFAISANCALFDLAQQNARRALRGGFLCRGRTND